MMRLPTNYMKEALVLTTVVLISGCASSLGQIDQIQSAEDIEHIRSQNHERLEEGKRLVKNYREHRHHTFGDSKVHRNEQQSKRLRRRHIYTIFAKDRAVSKEFSGGADIAAHFIKTPFSVIADVFAMLGDANIVVAEEIATEPVTFRVGRAPWRDALLAIIQTQNWVLDDDNGIIRVRRNHNKGDKSTSARVSITKENIELLQFLHVEPEDIKEALLPLFANAENKPVVSINERIGALIVKGTSEDIDLIELLVEELDRPVQQILIETFIVEASRGLERNLGTRLGINRFNSAGTIRIGGVAGGQIDSNESWAVNLPVAMPAGGIGILLDSNRLRLELTALEREGKTRIISNPRVFTLNGHEAVVFQGDEVPYFTVSESGTQTEFKEAGVRLAVTPTIIGDGHMELKVTVNKDTVDTRIQNPPITRRQIDTSLLVADGSIVTIGGIYFDTLVNTETRVPFLGHIPLLGRLFRRSNDMHDYKELLVFIAPKIVDVSS